MESTAETRADAQKMMFCWSPMRKNIVTPQQKAA